MSDSPFAADPIEGFERMLVVETARVSVVAVTDNDTTGLETIVILDVAGYINTEAEHRTTVLKLTLRVDILADVIADLVSAQKSL